MKNRFYKTCIIMALSVLCLCMISATYIYLRLNRYETTKYPELVYDKWTNKLVRIDVKHN